MADFLCSEAIVRHVFKRVVPLRANPSTLELRLPVPVLQDPVAHSAHGACLDERLEGAATILNSC